VSPKERILDRVRATLERREVAAHPGSFEGGRPGRRTASRGLERFEAMFRAAGGEVVRVDDLAGAAAWLDEAATDHGSLVAGEGVPDAVLPELARVRAEDAALGISWADAAIAETGTLVLNSRDGRRAQLLAPVHVVLLDATRIRETLVDALNWLRPDLPAAVGLHSGPSKSADIGQVMVRGVHGPGEVVAVLMGYGRAEDPRGSRPAATPPSPPSPPSDRPSRPSIHPSQDEA